MVYLGETYIVVILVANFHYYIFVYFIIYEIEINYTFKMTDEISNAWTVRFIYPSRDIVIHKMT